MHDGTYLGAIFGNRDSLMCECDAPRCERDGCQDAPTSPPSPRDAIYRLRNYRPAPPSNAPWADPPEPPTPVRVALVAALDSYDASPIGRALAAADRFERVAAAARAARVTA